MHLTARDASSPSCGFSFIVALASTHLRGPCQEGVFIMACRIGGHRPGSREGRDRKDSRAKLSTKVYKKHGTVDWMCREVVRFRHLVLGCPLLLEGSVSPGPFLGLLTQPQQLVVPAAMPQYRLCCRKPSHTVSQAAVSLLKALPARDGGPGVLCLADLAVWRNPGVHHLGVSLCRNLCREDLL